MDVLRGEGTVDHHHRGYLEHAWHVVRAYYERFTTRPVQRKIKSSQRKIKNSVEEYSRVKTCRFVRFAFTIVGIIASSLQQ